MKETIGTIKAVCKNCGHEWKPRNPDADTSRRKCSKCQSENVELKTEPAHSETNHEPTSDEIARLINKKIPDKPAQEKTSPATTQNTNETATENEQPAKTNTPPIILALILTVILATGGIILFRRKRKSHSKKSRKTPPQENKPQEEPRTTEHKTRIVGL